MPTVQVYLTRHAVQRFIERVNPGLDPARAEDQLAALVAAGELSAEPPAWWLGVEQHADAMYLVAGDLALPLRLKDPSGEYVAMTCVARGNIPAGERRHRNNCRGRRRQARRLAGAR